MNRYYIEGFIKRACDYGLSPAQALPLLPTTAHAALQEIIYNTKRAASATPNALDASLQEPLGFPAPDNMLPTQGTSQTPPPAEPPVDISKIQAPQAPKFSTPLRNFVNKAETAPAKTINKVLPAPPDNPQLSLALPNSANTQQPKPLDTGKLTNEELANPDLRNPKYSDSAQQNNSLSSPLLHPPDALDSLNLSPEGRELIQATRSELNPAAIDALRKFQRLVKTTPNVEVTTNAKLAPQWLDMGEDFVYSSDLPLDAQFVNHINQHPEVLEQFHKNPDLLQQLSPDVKKQLLALSLES